MPTAQDLEFGNDPWLNAEKLGNFKDWYAQALESVELSEIDPGAVPEYISYDTGYADAMKHVLREIYEAPTMVAAPVVNEIVEEVVEKGSIKRPILIVTAVGVGYLVYKNRRQIRATLKTTFSYGKNSVEEYDARGKDGLLQKTVEDLRDVVTKLEKKNERLQNG